MSIKINPYPIQVRYVDCDMAGHVNNAIYFSYFENARVHYFGQLFGVDRDWETEGILLRTNEIEYFSPIYLTDEPLIELYIVSIGTKSFTVGYEIRVNNELRTIGKSVIVCFNSKEKKTYVIPEKDRYILEQLKRNL